MIDGQDTDSAIVAIQKQLLKTLVDVLPVAEQKMREAETTKGVYGFNALVSQIREVLVDIQATSDKQFIAQSINVNILQPAFISIAQIVLDAHYRLKKEILDSVKPGDVKDVNLAIDQTAKSIAQFMQHQFQQTSERVSQQFEG